MAGVIRNKTTEKFRPPLFSVVHLRQCKIENAACSVMCVLQGRAKDVCVCTYIYVYAYILSISAHMGMSCRGLLFI